MCPKKQILNRNNKVQEALELTRQYKTDFVIYTVGTVTYLDRYECYVKDTKPFVKIRNEFVVEYKPDDAV